MAQQRRFCSGICLLNQRKDLFTTLLYARNAACQPVSCPIYFASNGGIIDKCRIDGTEPIVIFNFIDGFRQGIDGEDQIVSPFLARTSYRTPSCSPVLRWSQPACQALLFGCHPTARHPDKAATRVPEMETVFQSDSIFSCRAGAPDGWSQVGDGLFCY